MLMQKIIKSTKRRIIGHRVSAVFLSFDLFETPYVSTVFKSVNLNLVCLDVTLQHVQATPKHIERVVR